MKKIVSITACMLIIFSLLLTACGGSTDGDTSDGVSVAVVFPQGLGDKSFSDSANEGFQRLKEEGIVSTYSYFECNSDYSKAQPAFLDYASSGEYDLIVCASSSLREDCEVIAEQYPDQKFIMYDVTPRSENRENIYAVTYAQNEASFLVGLIAGKTTKTNVVGVIGGDDIEVINDFCVGYADGALEANPSCRVAVAYNGNWSDTAKMKELTLIQIQQGADICFNVAGVAGQGMFEAAHEKKTYAIGVDSDQAVEYEESYPEYAEVIITSSLKNVGDSMYRAVKKYVEGTLPFGEDEVLGIVEGGVGYANNKYTQAVVSQDTLDYVDEVAEKVASGEMEVETALGKDQAWIENWRNSIKP